MQQLENQPPRWAMAVFQFICHPDFQEEIEGDLLEKYQSDLAKYGKNKAQRQFYMELFSVVKLNLVFNFNRNTIMKPRNWFAFLFVVIAVILAAIAPFLPGPQNGFSQNISQFAQVIGFIGLAFIPFGLVWLIIEIRNKKGQKLNRWANGYYPAFLTLTPIFIFLPLQIFRAISTGNTSFDLWPLAIIFSVVGFFIYYIQKLKKKTDYKFNPMPLYIVLIPILTILTSKLAVEKMASHSRENIILKTEFLIAALEKYKNERGEYPDSLKDLEGKYISAIPFFNKMGINAYQYEKRGEAYQLSFEQNWHWSATEVVVYMKNGHEIQKANYENYPTNHPDWRYFMAD